MDVRKALFGWLGVGLLLAAATARAQEEPAAPDVKALKKQAQQWRAEERKLSDELRAIEDKIRKLPEVVQLRQAEQAADKLYQEKKTTDPAYAAAVKEQQAARTAYEQLIKAKLAQDADAKTVSQELAQSEDKEDALKFEIDLARLHLDHRYSPINLALAKDPELQKLRADLDAVERAYYADRTPANQEARDQARKAYAEAREAKKKAMPEAQEFYEGIAGLRKADDEFDVVQSDLHKKLREARRRIERGDDAELAAARQRIATAGKAEREAYNGEALVPLRNARNQARKAYSDKLRELLAADQRAAEVRKARDAVREQIRDADKKIRAAQKK